MNKIAIQIEYDGTRYSGWQIQCNSLTIQGELENALFEITGAHISITGAGRTDAGVHSVGQVASFAACEGFSIPIDKLCIAINSKLPNDIRVVNAAFVPNFFNARFDAIAREYVYLLTTSKSVFTRNYQGFVKYPLEPELLLRSGEYFLGKHNFTGFSKHNDSTSNYNCDVKHCSWSQLDVNCFKLLIKADRFVYAMVRSIVGSMIAFARCKITEQDIIEQLQRAERKPLAPLAPPEGLYLNKVYYPNKLF